MAEAEDDTGMLEIKLEEIESLDPFEYKDNNLNPKQALQQKVLELLDRIQTRKTTNFAVVTWNTWASQRNEKPPDDKIMADFHDTCGEPIPIIDEKMAIYISEIRCRDGQEYQKDSLKGLSHGLQRYMRCYNMYYSKPQVMIMKNYVDFPKFMKALTNCIKLSCSKKKRNSAKGISKKQEESLWDSGIFGIESARALSDTVYFYFVKIFGITSSAALRYVSLEDIMFSSDQYGDYLEFNKDTAFSQLLEPISNYNHALETGDTGKLRHYANPANPRTFYNIINFYYELVSLVDVTRVDINAFGFFLTPGKDLHFKPAAIGKNNLQKKFGHIMRLAGVQGVFTNQALVQSYHPLLAQHGYKARRTERFTIDEHLDICRILDPPSGRLNTTELEMALSMNPMDQQSLIARQQLLAPKLTKDLPVYNSIRKIIQSNKQIPPTLLMGQPRHQIHLIPVTVNTFLPQCPQIALPQLSNSSALPVSTSIIGNQLETLVNMAIKQEPIDIEPPDEQESSFLSQVRELEKADTRSHNSKAMKSLVASCSNAQKESTTLKRAPETVGEVVIPNKKPKATDVTSHIAKIVYVVTNDPDKKIFKQEISVFEDDQNNFSFSGTNKVGKMASDLDINLGDYLPENCTIKAEDIDIKRLVLGDGGKLVFNIKYSVPK